MTALRNRLGAYLIVAGVYVLPQPYRGILARRITGRL